MWSHRRPRPLKCSRPVADLAPAAGAASAPALCRTCWDAEDQDEGGKLVAPCACSGSMRYVHARCLAQWQQQLRQQKGVGASRRCDVCKAAWHKPHMPATTPRRWHEVLRDLMRSVPWPTVLEFWKFCVLSVGTVRGMQAGAEGFRCGVRWAAGASRYNIEELARWAPEMALAAGTMPPPLKVPMAVCLGAFVTGLAAQVALMSLVCAYASSLVGFASGVASSLLCTLRLGSSLLQQGMVFANAAASGAFRGAAATGRLAAPLLLGLLRTLALSRLAA